MKNIAFHQRVLIFHSIIVRGALWKARLFP
nr:MAG TPA: hypothetical protein [Caudoviricetes sp.]